MTEDDWQEIERNLGARIEASQLHAHIVDINDAALTAAFKDLCLSVLIVDMHTNAGHCLV